MIGRLCITLLCCALSFLPALAQQPATAADKNTAVISGRVVTLDKGRPLRRAQVSVLSPDLRERKSTRTNDEARWLGTIDGIHTSAVDQAGAFRFDTVRPGDYVALALEDFEQSDAADPAFLRELVHKGTRITVREGEPIQLSLKLAE